MALKSFKAYLKEDYIPNHRHELNENVIDKIQGVADVVSGGLSFIPGLNLVGSAIDAVSAGVDVVQGQYGDAALRGGAAALGVIPGVGAAAKIGAKAIKGATTIGRAGRTASAARTAAKVGKSAPKSILELPGRLAKDVKSVASGVYSGGKAVLSAPGKAMDLSGEAISRGISRFKDTRQATAAAKQLTDKRTFVKDLLGKGIKDPSIIGKAVERKFGSGSLAQTVKAGRQVGTKAPGAGLSAADLAAKGSKALGQRLLGRGIDPDAATAATGAVGAMRSRSKALAGKIRTTRTPQQLGSGPIRAARQTGVNMIRQDLRSQAGQSAPVEAPSSINAAPSAVLPSELRSRSTRTGGY